MRLTEKQVRDEVILRCIEFLDIAIHLILHTEEIYSTDNFEKRLKYNLIVYECQDVDVQQYIADFLQQIQSFFRRQLLDQIALVISNDDEDETFLRRYLFEFHPILVSTTNTTHQEAHVYFAELDRIFGNCLKEFLREKSRRPTTTNLRWKLQIRLCHQGNQKIDVDDLFIEHFQLADQCLTSVETIKSFHCQRLNLQLMCEKNEEDLILI